MKSHGKLLAFLAAWLATVDVAFLLPILVVFAADCNECMFCQDYQYAAIYQDGKLFIANGYSDPITGNAESQAFEGGACDDTSDWLYQAGACNTNNCGTIQTSNNLKVTSYNFPNYTCTLPEGASPGVQEFNGGTAYKSQGTTT